MYYSAAGVLTVLCIYVFTCEEGGFSGQVAADYIKFVQQGDVTKPTIGRTCVLFYQPDENGTICSKSGYTGPPFRGPLTLLAYDSSGNRNKANDYKIPRTWEEAIDAGGCPGSCFDTMGIHVMFHGESQCHCADGQEPSEAACPASDLYNTAKWIPIAGMYAANTDESLSLDDYYLNSFLFWSAHRQQNAVEYMSFEPFNNGWDGFPLYTYFPLFGCLNCGNFCSDKCRKSEDNAGASTLHVFLNKENNPKIRCSHLLKDAGPLQCHIWNPLSLFDGKTPFFYRKKLGLMSTMCCGELF